MTLFTLLIDPNPSSPANSDAGKLFKESRNKYEQRCLASMKNGSRIREKENEKLRKEQEERDKVSKEKLEDERLFNELMNNNDKKIKGQNENVNNVDHEYVANIISVKSVKKSYRNNEVDEWSMLGLTRDE